LFALCQATSTTQKQICAKSVSNPCENPCGNPCAVSRENPCVCLAHVWTLLGALFRPPWPLPRSSYPSDMSTLQVFQTQENQETATEQGFAHAAHGARTKGSEGFVVLWAQTSVAILAQALLLVFETRGGCVLSRLGGVLVSMPRRDIGYVWCASLVGHLATSVLLFSVSPIHRFGEMGRAIGPWRRRVFRLSCTASIRSVISRRGLAL